MSSPFACLKAAFADGAQAKRGGIPRTFATGHYKMTGGHPQPPGAMIVAWEGGWDAQFNDPTRRVEADYFQFCFDMTSLKGGLLKRTPALLAIEKENVMTTRTAEELEALKNDYRTTYTGDDAGFDAAFAAHLTSLDPAPAASATAKPAKPAKAAKAAKPAKPAKAAAAPKPAKVPAVPKAKAFRPASEDRQAFNAAATKVAGKDVATARLVPVGGKSTYTDFLQGKVLKLDADGSGSTVLNVVSAKDTKTVLGTVTVQVTKGKVKATGAKA